MPKKAEKPQKIIPTKANSFALLKDEVEESDASKGSDQEKAEEEKIVQPPPRQGLQLPQKYLARLFFRASG